MRLRGLIFLLAALALAAPPASAQTAGSNPDNYSYYGGFVYNPDIPDVLFMLGEIMDGDSFEFRRALREHQISLVVLDSPGGSVFEGLQIASILQDKALATYVPQQAMCASACSFVYFGGKRRMVAGDLGVHQFYSGGDAGNDQVTRDEESRSTQYTAAEIIGILNQFGTPPFVYEKMFSTDDIYVFVSPQKEQLALSPDDTDFVAARAEVDAGYPAMIAGFSAEATAPVDDQGATQIAPPSSGGKNNPFAPSQSQGSSDPDGQPDQVGDNPFAEPSSEGGNNPFAQGGSRKNPFAPSP